jgi:hypothetical protein
MAFWNRKISDAVEMDEAGVRRLHGDQIAEQVTWEALISVDVVATNDGPGAEDMFFILGGTDGTEVAVPAGLAPHGLLERLQQLPGFDSDQLILAASSVEQTRFHCWSSGEAP